MMNTERNPLVCRIAINAAKVKTIELEPGKYFIPTANVAYRCGKYLMLVRRNEYFKLIGWIIDTEEEYLVGGFLFADSAMERFGEVAGDRVCTTHRGEVEVSDDSDLVMRGMAVSMCEALASIEGKEVGDTLYIPTC